MKISDTSFYIIGNDASSTDILRMYKFAFTSAAPDWVLGMAWPVTGCYESYSESLLISSSIYSFFEYGDFYKYLYLAVISLSSGSVSVRYKSSINWSGALGSATKDGYVFASTYWNEPFLITYKIVTNTFSIKSFSSGNLFELDIETSTGR